MSPIIFLVLTFSINFPFSLSLSLSDGLLWRVSLMINSLRFSGNPLLSNTYSAVCNPYVNKVNMFFLTSLSSSFQRSSKTRAFMTSVLPWLALNLFYNLLQKPFQDTRSLSSQNSSQNDNVMKDMSLASKDNLELSWNMSMSVYGTPWLWNVQDLIRIETVFSS